MPQILLRISATRANSRMGLVADTVVACGLLYAGVGRHDVHLVTALLIIVLGLILFSFIEYCFHRWLFHGPVQLMEQGHHKHHQQPLAYDALPFFLPPLAMLALAATLTLVLPIGLAWLLSGGLAAGYAVYGLSHTSIHSIHFRHSLPRRWAAAHHIHHYHPDKNFGVTTPLWDIVLGTRYTSKPMRQSDPHPTGARAAAKR